MSGYERFTPSFAVASELFYPVVDGGKLSLGAIDETRPSEIRHLSPDECGKAPLGQGWKVFIESAAYGLYLRAAFDPTPSELLYILFDVEPRHDAATFALVESEYERLVWLHLRKAARVSAEEVECYLREVLACLRGKGIV